MPLNSVDEIAQWFIWRSGDVGDPITNLKLQKLVYYAQAWRIALTGEPLFEGDFQAWVHGPVNKPLYQQYKRFRWNPIDDDMEAAPKLSEDVVAHLEEVMVAYGGHSAWDLERLTHSEPPWIIARGTCAPDENCENIISPESMRTYFGSLVKDAAE